MKYRECLHLDSGYYAGDGDGGITNEIVWRGVRYV